MWLAGDTANQSKAHLWLPDQHERSQIGTADVSAATKMIKKGLKHKLWGTSGETAVP